MTRTRAETPWGRPTKPMGLPGRSCWCGTILSVYNPGPSCFAHTPVDLRQPYRNGRRASHDQPEHPRH